MNVALRNEATQAASALRAAVSTHSAIDLACLIESLVAEVDKLERDLTSYNYHVSRLEDEVDREREKRNEIVRLYAASKRPKTTRGARGGRG